MEVSELFEVAQKENANERKSEQFFLLEESESSRTQITYFTSTARFPKHEKFEEHSNASFLYSGICTVDYGSKYQAVP